MTLGIKRSRLLLQSYHRIHPPDQPYKQRELQPHQPVMVVASTRASHLAQEPQHGRKGSKWAEYTEEVVSQESALSQDSEDGASFCTVAAAFCSVSPMQPGSQMPAVSLPAPPVSHNTHHDIPCKSHCSNTHPQRDATQLSEPFYGSKQTLTASSEEALGGSQQRPGNIGPSSDRPTGHDNQTTSSLKVPALSKRKGFKAPAMVPGRQVSQIQSTTSPVLPTEKAPSAVDQQASFAFCGPAAGPLLRHVAIPTSFASLQAYKQLWRAALTEEINIRSLSNRVAQPVVAITPQACEHKSRTSNISFCKVLCDHACCLGCMCCI